MRKYDNPKSARVTAGFYKDIDDLRLKSSCSVFSVLVILFALLAIAVSLVVFASGGSKIKAIHLPFALKMPGLIKEKPFEQSFSSVVDGNRVTFKLTESDVAQLIGVKKQSFPLKDATLKIASDKLIISGKTSNSILSVRVDCWMMPQLEGDKITFKLLDVRAGKVAAPKYLADTMQTRLKMSIAAPSQNGVVMKDIKLYNEYLELIGEVEVPKSNS